MRMVTGIPIGASAAGHRRGERDLAGAGASSAGLDMSVIDRGADRARRLEGVGVLLAALRQPADQVGDGAHVIRRLQHFLGLADPLADPGKILHLHFSSSSMRWWMPARK